MGTFWRTPDWKRTRKEFGCIKTRKRERSWPECNTNNLVGYMDRFVFVLKKVSISNNSQKMWLSRKTTHTNGGFLSPLRIYTRTRYCDNCHDSCTCLCGGNAPRVFFSVLAMKRQTIYWWRLITTTTTGVTTGAPLFSVASTHHMSTLVWFRSWFPYVNE